jgi:hypothetical protein
MNSVPCDAQVRFPDWRSIRGTSDVFNDAAQRDADFLPAKIQTAPGTGTLPDFRQVRDAQARIVETQCSFASAYKRFPRNSVAA